MNNIQFTYDTPIMIWKHPENGLKVILDPMDNITDKNTEHGAYDYTYDDLYRLTTADNPIQNDEAFTYDDVGNRLTAADTTGAWAYNQNNELGSYDTTSFVYDDNGNMIQKTVDGVVISYFYNVEDRLTEVWDGEAGTGTLIAEYYYDPFGRRLWKEVLNVRTYFHYADEGLIGEYDSAGVEIKTYGYKPNSTWTTDPLFMKVGSEYYFYHNDHLGTPQKMTGVNGAVVWSAKYNSFGKATVEVETVENNLRFPGQYEDGETGLHYNYKRFYDSNIGRYLREDPLKISILTIQNQEMISYFASLYPNVLIDSNSIQVLNDIQTKHASVLINNQRSHIYLYALNNPLHFDDSTGEIAHIVGGVVGGAVGGAFMGGTFGAIRAYLNGCDIATGALRGARTGAILGGIGGGIAMAGVPLLPMAETAFGEGFLYGLWGTRLPGAFSLFGNIVMAPGQAEGSEGRCDPTSPCN